MHYYQFNISVWSLHTSHLTLEEECVYRRLLDYYYDTEKPIPEETKQVIRRLRLVNYEHVVEQILGEFFHLEQDGWHNNRADIEISDYQAKAEKARLNGKKGGRPKQNKGIETESVILANPEETTLKANYKLLTNNYELIEKNTTGKPAVTLSVWLEKIKVLGESPIQETDSIFDYASDAGIPIDYLRATWVEFKTEFSEKSDKKKDWRAHFRNFVRKNYYALWWIDSGEYKLTSRGQQAMAAMNNKDKREQ